MAPPPPPPSAAAPLSTAPPPPPEAPARAARVPRLPRPLLIDNYDSYTYNLHQMIAEVYGGEKSCVDLSGVARPAAPRRRQAPLLLVCAHALPPLHPPTHTQSPRSSSATTICPWRASWTCSRACATRPRQRPPRPAAEARPPPPQQQRPHPHLRPCLTSSSAQGQATPTDLPTRACPSRSLRTRAPPLCLSSACAWATKRWPSRTAPRCARRRRALCTGACRACARPRTTQACLPGAGLLLTMRTRRRNGRRSALCATTRWRSTRRRCQRQGLCARWRGRTPAATRPWRSRAWTGLRP